MSKKQAIAAHNSLKPEADAVLYACRVMHRRRVAPIYRFIYRIFYLFIDIDQLQALHKRLFWFSHNRFNLISFFDVDVGGRTKNGLRLWAEQLLADHGVNLDGGRIRLLTQPRMLGWAFNPLNLWYCQHRDGSLRAVIAEVANTFGERHSYVLASNGAAIAYGDVLTKNKCFHVSPLFDLIGEYHFTFSEPGERLRVVIHETRNALPLLDATVAGEARVFSNIEIIRQVIKMPVQALKVLLGIHWQALKIWLRGAKFHKKPNPPKLKST